MCNCYTTLYKGLKHLWIWVSWEVVLEIVHQGDRWMIFLAESLAEHGYSAMFAE